MLDTPAAVIEDIQFTNDDGANVHRITAEYGGHIVQVIKYDASLFLVVGIDANFATVHKDNLNTYIERKTGGA